MAAPGDCASSGSSRLRPSTSSRRTSSNSSARDGDAASTTIQPLTGSIHARVERRLANARGISSAVTWSLRARSEEHTSELQPLMRISYAVFCLKKKKTHTEDYKY